jgi:hypothetical protein
MSLFDLVEAAVEAACAPSGPLEGTRAAVRAVLEGLEHEGETARQAALLRMSTAVADASDVEHASAVALACGALVEEGASPMTALPAVLGRLPRAFQEAAHFVETCREDDDAAEGDERNCIVRCGAHVSVNMPMEARAWRSLEDLCLPAIAMLSRAKEARKTMPGKESLLSLASPLSDWHRAVQLFAQMLLVLDDEPLLALHPASRRGYSLRISGIADGFQLHALLADALVGDPSEELLEAARPDPLVIAHARGEETLFPPPPAVAIFDLVQWYGLDREGNVGDDTSTWFWNDGSPADLAHFEGVRTVLLTPPREARTWNVERAFSGMRAEAILEEKLSPEEVEARLHRMAEAEREDG